MATAITVHQISEGMPRKAPEPKKPVKVPFVTGIDRRSVIDLETPAKRPSVARVTRNEGSFT
ncbi:hypothetical protein D3C86_2220150 [compost metagenome]